MGTTTTFHFGSRAVRRSVFDARSSTQPTSQPDLRVCGFTEIRAVLNAGGVDRRLSRLASQTRAARRLPQALRVCGDHGQVLVERRVRAMDQCSLVLTQLMR